MTQPIHIIAGGITLTIAANPDLKLDPIANLITEERHDRRSFAAKQSASELYEELRGNGPKISVFTTAEHIACKKRVSELERLLAESIQRSGDAEIATLQKIIRDREQERDDAKAQATAAAEQIVSLEAALSEVRASDLSSSAEVKNVVTKWRAEVESLEKERDELRRIVEDGRASIEHLQAENETLRNGAASDDHQELFALKRERDELRTQIDDLATRLAKTEDERSALRNPQKIAVANEEQREHLTPAKQSKSALNAEQRDEIKQRVQTLRRSMANAPGVVCKSQTFISIRNDQLEAVRKHLKNCHLDFIDAEEVDGKFVRLVGQQ